MDEEYRTSQEELERRRLKRMEAKRKRIRRQRIILGVILAVIILIIVLICRGCAANKKKQEEEAAKQAALTALQEEAVGIKANLAAVGDIMCYTEQMEAVKTTDGKYDFTPVLSAIKPYLQSADLAVGNLELNFCGPEQEYIGYPAFNAPESLAATLSDVGFDILQTANTYSLQYGLNGLNGTIKYLTEQNIDHVGTYAGPAEKAKDEGVIFKDINGIKFAFFAYTKGMNNTTLPEGAEYCVDVLYKDYNSNYEQINQDALLKSVSAAKKGGADVIVAMLHWGSEYEFEPTDSQNDIAALLFQNGVDVILGSHSHEVGPMELRKIECDGKEKTVFIAYSLGNFMSAMTEGTTQSSCILNLEFKMDAETGDTTISNASYLPVYLLDKGEEAENRFETLPVRKAISSNLFPDFKEQFQKTITDLKTHTKSNFDSGK